MCVCVSFSYLVLVGGHLSCPRLQDASAVHGAMLSSVSFDPKMVDIWSLRVVTVQLGQRRPHSRSHWLLTVNEKCFCRTVEVPVFDT